MTEEQYKSLIKDAILELSQLFKVNPHFFLTEEDVRCMLFQLLVARLKFVRSNDGSLSSFVHAEVRWYGKEQNMHKRSDIVVLDTTDLRVTAEGFPLPSKGYGFNNFYAAIEIKLRRVGGESDSVWLGKLKKYVDTLLSLRREVVNAYDPLLFLIAFDRKANIAEKVRQMNFGVNVVYQNIIVLSK